MKYIITGGNFTSNLLYELEGKFGIKVLAEEELRKSDIVFHKEDKLFVPSQSSLGLVMERLRCPERLHAITELSDKYRCRSMMAPLFPDFEFSASALSDMTEDMFVPGRKYVIKPSKGFFGLGVRVLENPRDIQRVRDEIEQELYLNEQTFRDIFWKEDMIIEQFIEGDEYAVDMFYSEEGKPVIASITSHPLPSRKEYHHVLYYTNYRIFQRLYGEIESFFARLNSLLNIYSFPIHAEFKYVGGQLIPIELNPLRYGGFGLTDLSYYAHAQCPYFSFFEDEEYNWKGIWNESNQDKYYAWILAYKGAEVDTDSIDIKSTHAKLRAFIGDEPLLHYQGLDYRHNPVFAIAYLVEKNEYQLKRWLDVEFQDFFNT